MNRLVISAVVVGSLAATVHAQPTTSPNAPAPTTPAAPSKTAPGKTAPAKAAPGKAAPVKATLPAVGDTLDLNGFSATNKFEWLYDVPSTKDAAGKVVIHWFCGVPAKVCGDDLARIVTLKEGGRVYVIGYIGGNKSQAKRLDPIRESEGVGRGAVAYGRGASKLMKDLGLTTGPASVIVDVDGKVLMVTTSRDPSVLDDRDAKVAAAIGAIKEYVASSEGPKVVKPGEKFQLALSIKLASWLTYSDKTQMELRLTVPPDIKCDATTLKREQFKIENGYLRAAVTCSGPRGVYEARGELQFGYDTPGNGTGVGTESARWKFEIKA